MEERKIDRPLVVVCKINKICSGENTSRDTSEELQDLQVVVSHPFTCCERKTW